MTRNVNDNTEGKRNKKNQPWNDQRKFQEKRFPVIILLRNLRNASLQYDIYVL